MARSQTKCPCEAGTSKGAAQPNRLIMQIEITHEYLSSQGLSENFPRRFWKKVSKTESCWIWTGALCCGCGLIGMGGTGRPNIYAPRASWILNVGPIPTGFLVLHDCPGGDNRACVNPEHLWLGTQGDNMIDAAEKGQLSPPRGQDHFAHKLTDLAVIEIRKSDRTKELAEQYGVHRTLIQLVRKRKIWRHI